MRKWNKLLALVLAMVMVFGLTATAFAAESEDKTEDPKTETTAPVEGEEKKDDAAPAEGEEKKDDAAPAEGEEKKDDAEPAEGEEKKDDAEPAETPDAAPAADPYADVADWAKEAVAAVVEKKLIDMGETSFNPGESMTRGVLVEALYRLAEKPALAEDAEVKTFSDVAEDSAVAAAVAWASATGVVAGYDDGTFLPDKAMNRAEIAAVLYRYAKAEAEAEDKLAGFPDVADVQDWAKDPLNWAVANKLITGNGDKLDPAGTATRQQVALILNRYITEVLTPAEDDKAPAEGEDADKAPAEGEDADKAPAEGEDADKAPAEGEDADKAPAEGEGADKAPAEGEGTDKAPAEGEGTDKAPAEGEGTDKAPAEGEDAGKTE